MLQSDTLAAAMQDVRVVYYLVHSLGGGSNFPDQDLLAARNCAQSAFTAKVERIIYLGGLGNPQTDLSPHLRSRHDTGDALREAGVPVTEFGLLYWYLLYPIHSLIFSGLIRKIAEEARPQGQR
jgi:uncharacterized protein YbjT (DUF2867 family)